MSFSTKSTTNIAPLIKKLFNTFSTSADILIMQITDSAIVNAPSDDSLTNKNTAPNSDEQLLLAFGLNSELIEKKKITQANDKQLSTESLDLALAMNANLCSLGYCFSSQTINTLSFLPPTAFKKIYSIIKEIKKNQANHVHMAPLFPGFPNLNSHDQSSLALLQQTHYQNNIIGNLPNTNSGGSMANDEMLFANTVLHIANSTKTNKHPTFNNSNIKTLKFQGTDFLFKKLFEQISSKNPLSPENATNFGILLFVCSFLDQKLTQQTLKKAFDNAKHKENVAIAKAWIYSLSLIHVQHPNATNHNFIQKNEHTINADNNRMQINIQQPLFDDEFVKQIILSADTPTDILRLARLISAISNNNKNLFHQKNKANKHKNAVPLVSKNNDFEKISTNNFNQIQNEAPLTIQKFSTHLLELTNSLTNLNSITEAQTLHEKVKLFSFKRPLRRLFLQALDNHAKRQPQQQRENLFSQREQFLRLAEIIHPGQYKEAFPNTFEAFKDLQDNKPPINFEYKFEQLFKKNPQKAFEHLCGRPGVFGRNLMRSLKKVLSDKKLNKTTESWEQITQNIDSLNSNFKQIVKTIPTQLLLQLDTHLKNLISMPNKELANELANNGNKAFLPKAATVRPFFKKADEDFGKNKENLSKLNIFKTHIKNITQQLDEFKLIVNQEFSQRCKANSKNQFDSCYIDPLLKNVNVPFAVRTTNTSTKTLGLGSAIPIASFIEQNDSSTISNKKSNTCIRMFLYWNESGVDDCGNKITIDRTDIDLACVLLDEKFNKISSCSFSSYSNSKGVVHSGDFVSAPNGAAEFIDINLNEIEQKVAYISMAINNFNGIAYNEIPQCFAGIQINPKGKLVDPTAIAFKVDLNSKSYTNMPAFFDVKNQKFYWCDLPLSQSAGFDIANSKSKTIGMVTQSICTLVRPNLYDLFYNYATAIGATISNTPDGVDTHFCLFEPTEQTDKEPNNIKKTKIITAFDISTIQEQFLVDVLPNPDAQLVDSIKPENTQKISAPKIK